MIQKYFLIVAIALSASCAGRYQPVPAHLETSLKQDLEAAKRTVGSDDPELRSAANTLLRKIKIEAPRSELAEEAALLLIEKGKLEPLAELTEIQQFSKDFGRSKFLPKLLTGAISACAPLVRDAKSLDVCEPIAEQVTLLDFSELSDRRTHAMANLLLSRIASRRNDTEKALFRIERAIYFDPGQALLLIEKAKLLLAGRGPQEAKEPILTAAELDASNPDLPSLLGAIASKITEKEKPRFLYETALVKSASGDISGARHTLQRLISLFPEDSYSEKAKLLTTELYYQTPWIFHFEQARRKAIAKSRKLFVFVETELCPACTAIQQNLFSSVLVKKAIYDFYVPVRLDAEKNTKTAKQIGVTTIPSLVVLDPRTNRTVFIAPDTVPTEKEMDEALREHAR